jgi:thiamine-phosphate pyrophosphorylase
VLAGCEGVHVGQDDLPVPMIRRIAPSLRVGLSTHNMEQVERAVADRPDYVAFGPVFTTESKERPDPEVGLAELSRVAEFCPMPVVAIGGIDLGRAAEVSRHVPAAAVIAALLPDGPLTGELETVTERAQALHAALLHSTARVA